MLSLSAEQSQNADHSQSYYPEPAVHPQPQPQPQPAQPTPYSPNSPTPYYPWTPYDPYQQLQQPAVIPNPCGEGGVVHPMAASSPLPYYCTCGGQDQYFGASCAYGRVEANPCQLYNTNNYPNDAYFTTRLDSSLFIQCSGPQMFLLSCPRPLQFSMVLKRCEWNVSPSPQPQPIPYGPQPVY